MLSLKDVLVVCGVFFRVCLALPALLCSAETNRVERVTVSALASHTGEAFSYQRVLKEKVRNHSVYEIKYPSSVISPHEKNNTVPAELYLPAGISAESKVPAVVCMHILNGDFALCRMMCSRLSEAGIAALFFLQPYYGERGGEAGRRTLLASVDTLISGFDQSTADARRAFDVIQSVEGVDPDKCGVSGISLGAIRAGALCAFEPRIKRAYLSLVAGDLKQVILTARETRDLRGFIEKLNADDQQRVWECVQRQDPLNAVARLHQLGESGRLRMMRAEKDQIMLPECSLKLFKSVNSPQSEICLVGMGHYSAMAGLAGIMDDLTSFFAEDMPAEWKPSNGVAQSTSIEMLGWLLKDLAAFLQAQPQKGCAHMVGIKCDFKVKGKPVKFDFDLALGEDGYFNFSGNFPEVGRAGVGRSSFPWIIGGQKRVFCGTRISDSHKPLGSLINPQAMLRYRMAVGLAAGASLSPDLINNYAVLSVENEKRTRILCIKSKVKKSPGEVRITFDSSGRFPQSAVWASDDSTGSVEFTHWQVNAASESALFEPQVGLEKQEVSEQDVLQMFASVFQFVVEYFE